MTAQAQTAIEERTDDRLYYVTRFGHIVKRTWAELSRTEKAQQLEAEARAAYVAMFDIY
jgi:hypothetical protein